MEIHSPLCITSRLLPGVRIGEATISIEYGGIAPNFRQRYRWWIDLSDNGGEFKGNELSAMEGSTLQEGLESLLGFLSAFAKAIAYQERSGRESENADLFPAGLADWATANADELSVLECELQEHPGELIVE